MALADITGHPDHHDPSGIVAIECPYACWLHPRHQASTQTLMVTEEIDFNANSSCSRTQTWPSATLQVQMSPWPSDLYGPGGSIDPQTSTWP